MATHPSKVRSHGISMLPFIQDGAILHVDFSQKRFELGDVVIVYIQGRLMAHRIIAWNKKCSFQLKGDNNPLPDGYFTHSEILGKVVAIQQKNRTMRLNTLYQTVKKWMFILALRV